MILVMLDKNDIYQQLVNYCQVPVQQELKQPLVLEQTIGQHGCRKGAGSALGHFCLLCPHPAPVRAVGNMPTILHPERTEGLSMRWFRGL